jgi:putative beta-lysine N-acetyltransferase
VFETYPFPIYNPGYILKTMDENVQYFGAEKDGEIAALSSAEIDFKGGNAEMTDFATHFAHTGNNLASLLLKTMEEEMEQQGISTLYTIARLNSIPMNKTFLQNEYQYSGTLINNTNIAGKIESMNIYYKQI